MRELLPQLAPRDATDRPKTSDYSQNIREPSHIDWSPKTHMKRRFCKPLVLHICLLLLYSLLGIFGISQLRRKRTTDSEYLYISGDVGENQASESLFSVKREHFTFVDLPQKVVPSTNQFSIGFSVVKCSKYNHFFIRGIKVLLIDPGLAWDDFLGRCRAENVFAFHEFSIFFDSVFCKMSEMI